MRLLHTKTVRLQDFYGSYTPPYAILSHRWGDEEVILQDVLGLRGDWDSLDEYEENAAITSKEGFDKLARAVALARRNDFEFIWVDTCCIDKTSSAELSEAINSMYHWYEKADVCYAFIPDAKPAFEDDMYAPSSSFRESSWFKRGWTLQELIAPSEVEFFASDWSYMGNKRENNQFTELLMSITGVPTSVLLGDEHPSETSVASRMGWAAKRETTRVEDIAYCLLGLFDVNMPLLYGEGEKAFIRLQEQILSQTDDETIFAWHAPEPSRNTFFGLLAEHPSYFPSRSNVEPVPRLTIGEPWSMTSKGLRVDFRLQECTDTADADYFVILNCETRGTNRYSPVIFLKRIWVDEFARVVPHKRAYRYLQTTSSEGTRETVFVKQKPSRRSQYIRILAEGMSREIGSDPWTVRDVHPRSRWSDTVLHLKPSDFRFNEALALLRIDVEDCGIVDVAVGLKLHKNKSEFGSWCLQLRADKSNWQVEDNFWVLNQLLRNGSQSIPELTSDSTTDINGKRLPTRVKVRELYGVRTLDLVITVSKQTVNPNDSETQDVLLHNGYSAGDTYPQGPVSGLEVIDPDNMPVILPGLQPFQLPREKHALIRAISLKPVEDMEDLSRIYVQGLNAFRKMTTQPLSFSHTVDWNLSIERGHYLHELSKADAQPPINPDTLHFRCYQGSLETSILTEMPDFVITEGDPILGLTPLHWAILGKQYETMILLLEHCPLLFTTLAPWDISIFHVAAALGDWTGLNYLVQYMMREDTNLSAAVSRSSRLNALTAVCKSTGDTPLHFAAAFVFNLTFWDNLSMHAWNYLVGNSTSPQNVWGATPLHLAALTGNLAAALGLCARPVIRSSDNLNIDLSEREQRSAMAALRSSRVDNMSRSVAWYAAFSDSPEVLKRLWTTSATVSLADDNGFAPVHIACALGHTASLTSLLAEGTMNAATSDLTLLPTHVAAIYGQLECLKILLEHGAGEVWEKSEYDDDDTPLYSPITLALANGHMDCVRFLWERHPVPYSGFTSSVVIRNGRAFVETLEMLINEEVFRCRRLVEDDPVYPEPTDAVQPQELSRQQRRGRSWLPWGHSARSR